MRSSLAILLSGSALAGAALAGAGPAAADTNCPDWDLQPAADTMKRVAASIVCLINEQRAASGLRAVREDTRLDASSTAHARDMVANHYLDHARSGGPSVLTRIRSTGYFDRVAGGLYTENVGLAPQGNASPWAIVYAWMDSEEHRVNILRPEFRDMGVGIVLTGPDPAFYEDYPSVVFATDFGRRYYSAPVPICVQTRSSDPSVPKSVCTKRASKRRKRHRRARR